MEKKVIKKILALLMIITILTTDFFVLGSNLTTYASQNNSETNNSNIEFSAYFKNEEGEKVDSINKSIKSEDIKLYAKITVKNEGYFNGTIEIEDSNFSIKNEILSTKIVNIEENKVKLKQINAGETVEIELGVEPISLSQMTVDMLSKTTTVKITGTYMESTYEGLTISANKFVSLNYLIDENAQAELETDIITNKVFTINGTNKRIVQLLIKSRLTDNQYPVEQTTLSVNIPNLGNEIPEVKVLAANSRTQVKEYTTENGLVKVTLNNVNDNKITWDKNGYDEVIVTFVYNEDVDARKVETTTNSEIKVYNSTNEYKANHIKMLEGKELDNTVIATPEITTTELYKGQLYANTSTTEKQKISYNTKTTLVVTDINVAKEIVINEGLDKFVLENGKTLNTDSNYESIEFSKQQLLNVLGTNGNVTIQNGDKTLGQITNISQIENENIVIKYIDLFGELKITTSKPIAEGFIEIKHSKGMTENEYSRKQIKEIKEIKITSSVQGTSSEQNPKETSIELKETISKAEIVVLSENTLSTIEANDVKLGITLNSDSVEYDLYNNPIIAIQLPASVESVEFNTVPTIQNVSDKDKITIESYGYDKETKQIKIKIKGEQTSYPGGSLSELYIPLDLKITLSKLAATQNTSVKMMYTNANASEYYGGTTEVGVAEQLLKTEAPTGLIKYFNLKTNENTSTTEEIVQRILNANASEQLEFEIALVNNTDADMNNVKILGKLPTTGILENTLETTLKSLTAPNATIYFTENSSATHEINDENNGWTTQLSSKAKLFLIELGTFAKGNNYTSTVKVQIPNEIVNGLESYTQYEVIYESEGETQTETSRKIGLKMVSDLEVELMAQVGQEILTNGNAVKEGEVVRYTVTVKNNTDKTFENVQIKAQVPNGTTLVEPVEMYVYSNDPFYYEEKSNINEINITLPTLADGETNITQYEVRVNMDAVLTVAEISNKAIVTHEDLQIESDEIKNTLRESDIRVTIKRADDESAELTSGGAADYHINIENFSNKDIQDLEMQIISDMYNAINVKKYEEEKIKIEAVYEGNKIFINKIPANGNIIFQVHGKIMNNIEEFNIYAKVTKNQEKYKSNVVTEQLPNIDAEISVTSPQNNAIIKPNENVTYNITVKNTGEEIDGKILVEGTISEYLKVESISINGNTYLQTVDAQEKLTYVETIPNKIMHYETVKMQNKETIQITITAKVKEIPVSVDGNSITNKFNLKVYSVLKDSSEEIKHVLDCGQKNIITGLAWLDADADGKKEEEETLSGVTVKLYNISTKQYLKDGEGNIITTQTGTGGEYEFTQIPNGSYIIVFEHEMEEYEPTICQATGTETSENSKAKLEEITLDGNQIIVAGIKINNMQDEIINNQNIGLKVKTATPPQEGETGEPEDPSDPGKPEEPVEDKKQISGYAWLDLDRDGEKDDNETLLKDIIVKIYDVSTNDYLKDNKGNIIKTVTDAEGMYKFTNIEKGLYILIFEYDTEEYEPTTYLAEGIEPTKNSKVVLKKVNINGEEITTAVTDTINVQEDISNINIGLREKLVFDLELNKYINRIVVQNSKETKAYDYKNETFAKAEIHRKRINGSLVVLEYVIKVKNNGEVAGYAKNIVDYLPSGLTFSSELNTDWYLSGNYLYTKGLENVRLQPGEEKEIKLILTKTMTNDNVGLINNRAEIYQDYNEYGIADIDSIANNQIQDEDDLGSADVIILVSTGGGSFIAYITLLIINIILIGIAIRLMIQNNIIKIKTKRGRR